MHRLFIALRPPPSVRARLRATMVALPGARWQDDEQLHLTLRFIGSVETAQAEDIAAALAGIAAPAPELRVDGVGSFDTRGHVDTLWARIPPAPALLALQRKVAQALSRAAVAPEERRFTPHVTLARFGRGGAEPAALAAWTNAHAGLATPPFTCAHLLLYESHLGREGARYEAVTRWPLG